jgi:hypothetical protein
MLLGSVHIFFAADRNYRASRDAYLLDFSLGQFATPHTVRHKHFRGCSQAVSETTSR